MTLANGKSVVFIWTRLLRECRELKTLTHTWRRRKREKLNCSRFKYTSEKRKIFIILDSIIWHSSSASCLFLHTLHTVPQLRPCHAIDAKKYLIFLSFHMALLLSLLYTYFVWMIFFFVLFFLLLRRCRLFVDLFSAFFLRFIEDDMIIRILLRNSIVCDTYTYTFIHLLHGVLVYGVELNFIQ